jgi:hypothetical protein
MCFSQKQGHLPIPPQWNDQNWNFNIGTVLPFNTQVMFQSCPLSLSYPVQSRVLALVAISLFESLSGSNSLLLMTLALLNITSYFVGYPSILIHLMFSHDWFRLWTSWMEISQKEKVFSSLRPVRWHMTWWCSSLLLGCDAIRKEKIRKQKDDSFSLCKKCFVCKYS